MIATAAIGADQQRTSGNVAEWLTRLTRNQLPSGAHVRIMSLSSARREPRVLFPCLDGQNGVRGGLDSVERVMGGVDATQDRGSPDRQIADRQAHLQHRTVRCVGHSRLDSNLEPPQQPGDVHGLEWLPRKLVASFRGGMPSRHSNYHAGPGRHAEPHYQQLLFSLPSQVRSWELPAASGQMGGEHGTGEVSGGRTCFAPLLHSLDHV